MGSEKTITVPESLALSAATSAAEAAQIYLSALTVIARAQVTSDEAKKLQAVACEAIKLAGDNTVLPQEVSRDVH